MSYETLLTDIRGDGALRTGLITLNRPKAMNALNDELMDELDALVAADKPAVKAPAAKAPVEKLPDLGPKVPNRPLPASPVAEKAPVEDDEEAALRALEAELPA